MHRKLAFFSIIFSLIFSEIFFYNFLKEEINSHKIVILLYFFSIGIFFFTLIKSITKGQQKTLGVTSYLANFTFGFAFTLFVTKLSFTIASLLGIGFNFIFQLALNTSENNFNIIKLISGLFSLLPFLSFLYGITKGKYNYKVIKVPLYFENLPEQFEGYKVLQISDVHAGSFDSKKQVQKGINLINKQQADIICFTGDLVNNYADEIVPFIPIFKQIQAKDGKYAITGNHDYADYVRWDSLEEKKENFNALKRHHKEMGFQLLLNEHRTIERDTSKITIVGVENWGMPPFKKLGDIAKATEGLTPADFKILLSHDPSHWDEEVKKHKLNFKLTMSGHTHGMQFGLDLKPLIKWSPVKYKYPKWAGIYEYNKKYLYVNKGFGFLGFPGRVGMWPEITVFELKKFTYNKS